MSVYVRAFDDEPAWIEARLPTIGASEVPALFGEVSPRMDASKARERLIAEKVTGVRRKPSAATLRRRAAGKIQESQALLLVAEKLKLTPTLRPCGWTIYTNDALPGLHATPDAWLCDGVLAEAKAIGPDGLLDWGDFTGYQGRWKWNDEPPVRVWLQAQAQMGCTEARLTHVVCVAGTDWDHWPVERDEDVIRRIGDEVVKALDEINERKAAAKEAEA